MPFIRWRLVGEHIGSFIIGIPLGIAIGVIGTIIKSITDRTRDKIPTKLDQKPKVPTKLDDVFNALKNLGYDEPTSKKLVSKLKNTESKETDQLIKEALGAKT